MPTEHVEQLRRRLEAWNAKRELEAWKRGEPPPNLSVIDPDVVYKDNFLPDHVGETYRWFRDGTVIRIEGYFNPDLALDAAGLDPLSS